MSAAASVISRMNAMREKLEKSRSGAAEGMARFMADASPSGGNAGVASGGAGTCTAEMLQTI